MKDLSNICINPHHTLRQVMSCIDKNMKEIALVVNKERRLLYTITDGDLRRVVLHGLPLDMTVEEWARQQPEHGNRNPVTALQNTPVAELLQLMKVNGLRHIPLTDDEGRVTDMLMLSDLIADDRIPLKAVVMAGGLGKRLHPLTKDLPKPMLPVGERPLLELIIEQLRKSGIRQVNMATRYKKDCISNHFGDGGNFGVEIRYVEENRPLGTAGALSLLKGSDEPILVINGDVLTGVDFRAMNDFHHEQRADMTVAVKQHEMSVPYGVINANGPIVTGVSEKPVVQYFINAGIYLLSPSICQLIPDDQPYDMTDLIAEALSNNRRVISFPVREYWLDIGHAENYQRALTDIENGKI